MKEYNYTPDVVDFAYQIISLHKENEELRYRLEHYEEMEKLHLESIRHSNKHTKEMTGIIIGAVLDPDSIINKGQRAIIELESKD